MHFAFYDLETSGIVPAFDQPLQFAAILTDGQLRELERVELRCRIAPHIIPAPQALAVTGVRPAQLVDHALPGPLEFAQSIQQLIARWSPAIWTGFNSIAFDEEMLRQLFYQTLQPDIFATQIQGNTRFDMLTAAYAVRLRNPGLLEWPEDATGRLSFKLDRIAPRNGFAAHNAHDALGDVEATIFLARRIAEGDPALWAQLLDNRDKARVQARLESFAPMELVQRFRGAPPSATTGCFCGFSPGNPNEAALFDIEAADPADWLQADDAALAAAVTGSSRIIHPLAINKAPALMPAPAPSAELTRRAQVVANAPEFRARVGAALAARFAQDPDAPAPPVERQIYAGFFSHSDKALLREFQSADWPRRQEIVASLSDARLRQLGRRLVAAHAPELLSPAEAAQYRDWLRARWSVEAEWTSLAKARRDLGRMRADGAAPPALLDEIDAFLDRFEG